MPRGTVNIPPCRFRSLQGGASNSAGTAVVALFSSPSVPEARHEGRERLQ